MAELLSTILPVRANFVNSWVEERSTEDILSNEGALPPESRNSSICVRQLSQWQSESQCFDSLSRSFIRNTNSQHACSNGSTSPVLEMLKTSIDTQQEACILFVSADGDVFSSTKARYRVLHKLGRGAFSTVWLAEALQESSHQYVALKICVARADPKHELEVFNRVSHRMYCSFGTTFGPNGIHTVLVLNVLGSLLSLVMSPNGPRPNLVRKICRDITVGLAALHRQGIVHGDFGNPECTIVLPITHPADPEAVPPYLVPPISLIDYLIAEDRNLFDGPLHVEIMDLGSAIIVDEQIRPACTASAVFAPELLFERIVRPTDPGSPPTQASDIWSLACTIYELMFGTRLFHLTNRNSLLGRMAELCGEVSPEWKEYWDSQEELRNLCE